MYWLSSDFLIWMKHYSIHLIECTTSTLINDNFLFYPSSTCTWKYGDSRLRSVSDKNEKIDGAWHQKCQTDLSLHGLIYYNQGKLLFLAVCWQLTVRSRQTNNCWRLLNIRNEMARWLGVIAWLCSWDGVLPCGLRAILRCALPNYPGQLRVCWEECPHSWHQFDGESFFFGRTKVCSLL